MINLNKKIVRLGNDDKPGVKLIRENELPFLLFFHGSINEFVYNKIMIIKRWVGKFCPPFVIIK